MILLRALEAEFRKVLSTRGWWLLAVILVGYVGISAAGIALALSVTPADTPGFSLPADFVAPLVYSMTTAAGFVFPLIAGALSITGEVRHRTLATAFLATPQRGVVLVAKAIVGLALGAVYGLAGTLATVGLGAPLLAATGQETLLGDPDTWLLLGRIVLAMALWGLLGVAIGVAIPSQIGSIVVILAFTQFVEPLLRTAAAFVTPLSDVGRFLPGAAGDALVGTSFYAVFAGATGSEALEWWQGGLVLAAYAAVLGLVGAVTTWRRDVT